MTEKELIELWHSDLLIKDIAAKFGVQPNEISLAWRKLKERDLLPRGDRPRSRSARYFNEVSGGDGRPHDDGSMLEALQRAHPERMR
jgi:hypothetical protein